MREALRVASSCKTKQKINADVTPDLSSTRRERKRKSEDNKWDEK